MQRTYSRRGTRRIARSAASSPERDAEPLTQRKRRRIQVEVVGDEESEKPQWTDAKSRAPSTTHTRVSPSKPEQQSTTANARSRQARDDNAIRNKAATGEDIITKSLNDIARGSSPTKATGLAKRMLRRSRTDPSVESVDHISSSQEKVAGPSTIEHPLRRLGLTRTQSIIDLTESPVPGSQPSSPSKAHSLDDVSSPVRPPLAKSNVKTYAGRSRSFLVALPSADVSGTASSGPPTQDLDDPALGHSQEEEAPRESYTDLRLRWGVDNSEDDPYPLQPVPDDDDSPRRKGKAPLMPQPLPPGMMNDLKSISELRSKGEVRRFLDEMGYLFEGLVADAALGVRRGSASEIVSKLCDADFARRAKAADFLGRAWDALRAAGAGDGDKVLDAVLLFFVALVARDPVDLAELATKPGFVPTLYTMLGPLDCKNDPLWLITAGLGDPALKRAGIGRAEATALKSLHKMIRKKSGIFSEGEQISNRLLASRTLSALPPALNNPSYIPDLLRSLSSELHPIPARLSAYTSGLPLFSALDTTSYTEIPSLAHINYCLRLLDTTLLGQWADDEDVLCRDVVISEIERNPGFGSHLLTLINAMDVISRSQEADERRENAHRCIESAFRVFINLTHDDEDWCNRLVHQALPTTLRIIAISHKQRLKMTSSQPPPESETDDDSSQLLDRMCLALGLLTNLVQSCSSAKDYIRNIVQSLDCAGRRSCIELCECPSAVDALSCLGRIYTDQCASDDDLDSVVRGHVAVLLGLLMEGSIDNQRLILAVLPGTGNRDKLRSLIDNAREFTLFYANFAKKVAEASQEVENDMEDDRESVEGGVQSVLHAAKGETVANNVIRYLEELSRGTWD